MVAPKGRPPLFHKWVDGLGYVHVQTGEKFDRLKHKDFTRARKCKCERIRYWDPRKTVRLRRLSRNENIEHEL